LSVTDRISFVRDRAVFHGQNTARSCLCNVQIFHAAVPVSCWDGKNTARETLRFLARTHPSVNKIVMSTYFTDYLAEAGRQHRELVRGVTASTHACDVRIHGGRPKNCPRCGQANREASAFMQG
jgi:hypothetical protein